MRCLSFGRMTICQILSPATKWSNIHSFAQIITEIIILLYSHYSSYHNVVIFSSTNPLKLNSNKSQTTAPGCNFFTMTSV